jgi:hypothetical protein
MNHRPAGHGDAPPTSINFVAQSIPIGANMSLRRTTKNENIPICHSPFAIRLFSKYSRAFGAPPIT